MGHLCKDLFLKSMTQHERPLLAAGRAAPALAWDMTVEPEILKSQEH